MLILMNRYVCIIYLYNEIRMHLTDFWIQLKQLQHIKRNICDYTSIIIIYRYINRFTRINNKRILGYCNKKYVIYTQNFTIKKN